NRFFVACVCCGCVDVAFIFKPSSASLCHHGGAAGCSSVTETCIPPHPSFIRLFSTRNTKSTENTRTHREVKKTR
ncbi:hypothetical protein LDENG_00156900, partial [Lucifuga dentata]